MAYIPGHEFSLEGTEKLVEGKWLHERSARTSKQPHHLLHVTTYVNPLPHPTRSTSLRSEAAHGAERIVMSSNSESEVDKASEVILCLWRSSCHETAAYIESRSVTNVLPDFKLCLSRSLLQRASTVALHQIKTAKLRYLKTRVIQP